MTIIIITIKNSLRCNEDNLCPHAKGNEQWSASNNPPAEGTLAVSFVCILRAALPLHDAHMLKSPPGAFWCTLLKCDGTDTECSTSRGAAICCVFRLHLYSSSVSLSVGLRSNPAERVILLSGHPHFIVQHDFFERHPGPIYITRRHYAKLWALFLLFVLSILLF